jgi:hypothetical protein
MRFISDLSHDSAKLSEQSVSRKHCRCDALEYEPLQTTENSARPSTCRVYAYIYIPIYHVHDIQKAAGSC